MTREEFEKELEIRVKDLRAFYHRYNRNACKTDGYLSISIYNDMIMAFNMDKEYPVDLFRKEYTTDKEN